uniref:hypothetical protein n=1 Tax=Alloprevotella sp. TaxID=1872471 RepID=UPI00402819D6
MKKFTFLLSLLLAFVGVTASAQVTMKKLTAAPDLTKAVTNLDDLVNGGTYVFYNINNQKYINIDNYDNLHFGRAAELSVDKKLSASAVFTFHITKGETTTYTFETAVSGKYMPAAADNNNDGGATAADAAASFVILTHTINETPSVTKDDGSYVIKNASDDKAFDMSGDDFNQFCGWQGKGANCWYKIVPVTVSETETVTARNVTFTVQNAEGVTDASLATSTTAPLADGDEVAQTISMNPSKASAWYTLECQATNKVVAADNATFVYKLTEGTAPFAYSTSTDRKWYLMRFQGSDNNFASYLNTTDANINVETAVKSFTNLLANEDKAFWSFEKSGYGVKVYNKLANKYLYIPTGNNQELLQLNDEGTELIVRPNNKGGFSLQKSGNANACFGHHVGANLGVWNNGDSYNAVQSKVEFYPVLDKAKGFLTSNVENVNTNVNLLGVYMSDADKAALKTEFQNATDFAALKTVNNKLVKAVNTTPDENAYYQIKSVAGVNKKNYIYMSTINAQVNNTSKELVENNANATRIQAGKCNATTLWKFVPNDDKSAYYLLNVNLNAYLGKITANNQANIAMVKDKASTAAYKLNHRSGTKFALVLGDHCINAFEGGDSEKIGRYDNDGDGKDSEGNTWYLEKVTPSVSVPVSDAKYASVSFPYATQVTDNVKAYYASEINTDGVITLSEYADGVIPANQGAILYNDGGATTAVLNILTSSTAAAPAKNYLNAAVTKLAGFGADETYALGKKENGEVAFMLNGLTVITANKAYINKSDLTSGGIASNVLNFGQVATGVNTVVAGANDGVQYFDLQGRRVLYPAHGIFVTNTGKKVLVK